MGINPLPFHVPGLNVPESTHVSALPDPPTVAPTGLLAGTNPQQAAAITYGYGPLLIDAGPGSGKTVSMGTKVPCRVSLMTDSLLSGLLQASSALPSPEQNQLRHRIGTAPDQGVLLQLSAERACDL